MLTMSSPPRLSFRTLVSETSLPVVTFRITSNTANISLRCGRWVQTILAPGLGLVQCENLKRGRATGPCATVDNVETDEGAMHSRPLPVEDNVQIVHWQSNHRVIIYVMQWVLRWQCLLSNDQFAKTDLFTSSSLAKPLEKVAMNWRRDMLSPSGIISSAYA